MGPFLVDWEAFLGSVPSAPDPSVGWVPCLADWVPPSEDQLACGRVGLVRPCLVHIVLDRSPAVGSHHIHAVAASRASSQAVAAACLEDAHIHLVVLGNHPVSWVRRIPAVAAGAGPCPGGAGTLLPAAVEGSRLAAGGSPRLLGSCPAGCSLLAAVGTFLAAAAVAAGGTDPAVAGQGIHPEVLGLPWGRRVDPACEAVVSCQRRRRPSSAAACTAGACGTSSRSAGRLQGRGEEGLPSTVSDHRGPSS